MKICVYAIAKNEEKFVKPFMESAKEADAIYLLDTGSTDNTVKLAQEMGAIVKVQTFSPWRFDVARNASLDMVPEDADICICLDLDEVMLPGWRQEIEKAWTPKTTRLRYRFIWSHKDDGSPDLEYWADKIHARAGYRWKHPVHETMTYDGTEVQTQAGLVIEHFPDKSKPRSQYLPLLALSVQEDPEDDRNAHYYARELFFVGRYPEAEKEFLRHLSLPRAKWDAERAASMRYLAKIAEASKDSAGRLRWLLRACAEAPGEREPWVELAQAYQSVDNFAGIFFAAKQAQAIRQRPPSYITQAFAWGPLPYMLGSLGAWYSGARQEALWMAKEAVRQAPDDKLLETNLKVIQQRLIDPYATHQRLLAAALGYFDGPVLEVGCGHYSTPWLHGFCAGAKRPLLTVETDRNWAEQFLHLQSPNHQFRLGEWTPDALPSGLDMEDWGVVFIDCETLKRVPVIKRMLYTAKALVLHDVEDPAYGYGPAIEAAPFRVFDRTSHPQTALIASQVYPDFQL